jgi:hypothetical protein
MIPLPTTAEFLDWQIGFYKRRLAEETKPEARRFLRNQLFHLKLSKLIN